MTTNGHTPHPPIIIPSRGPVTLAPGALDWDISPVTFPDGRVIESNFGAPVVVAPPGETAPAQPTRSGDLLERHDITASITLADLEPALRRLTNDSEYLAMDDARVEALIARVLDITRRAGLRDVKPLVIKMLRRLNEKGKPQVETITDDDAPWPHAVDGGEILDSLDRLFTRHIVFRSEHERHAAILWIVHTFLADAVRTSPLLLITSPTKQCGKSTMLDLTGALVRKALPVANISGAAIYRVIEQECPTLLIDEADTFLKDNREIRGIVNSGHTRANAFVARCEGDDHLPKRFSTWAPKVLAMIRWPHDTIVDRSVVITMARKTRADRVEPLRLDRLSDTCTTLRRKLRRWAEDHRQVVASTDPAVPGALQNRAADNWRPLLAIAAAVGGVWPDQAAAAAVALAAVAAGPEDAGVMLLGDLQEIFQEAGDPDFLDSGTILERLVDREDRPWPEWKAGNPLSGKGLATLLKAFGIEPIRVGRQRIRGYQRKDFIQPWERYLAERRGRVGRVGRVDRIDVGEDENFSNTGSSPRASGLPGLSGHPSAPGDGEGTDRAALATAAAETGVDLETLTALYDDGEPEVRALVAELKAEADAQALQEGRMPHA